VSGLRKGLPSGARRRLGVHGPRVFPASDASGRGRARKAILDTIAAIRDFAGHAPRGWESPGLTETTQTLDLLAEAGIEYVADWVVDDQPIPIRTRKNSLVSVPYSVEINDVVITAISLHPYLTGVPHRIGYLEQLYDYILGHQDVMICTGEQILDWYLSEMSRLRIT